MIDTYKQALEIISSGIILCRTCRKQHPWRCSNPAHPAMLQKFHACSVKDCTASGTFVALEDNHPYDRMLTEELAREVLNGGFTFSSH